MILIDFLENLVIPSEVVNIFVPFGDKFWQILTHFCLNDLVTLFI